jgi:hypothetical protein
MNDTTRKHYIDRLDMICKCGDTQGARALAVKLLTTVEFDVDELVKLVSDTDDMLAPMLGRMSPVLAVFIETIYTKVAALVSKCGRHRAELIRQRLPCNASKGRMFFFYASSKPGRSGLVGVNDMWPGIELPAQLCLKEVLVGSVDDKESLSSRFKGELDTAERISKPTDDPTVKTTTVNGIDAHLFFPSTDKPKPRCLLVMPKKSAQVVEKRFIISR